MARFTKIESCFFSGRAKITGIWHRYISRNEKYIIYLLTVITLVTLLGVVYSFVFFIMKKINNVIKLVLTIHFWDAGLAFKDIYGFFFSIGNLPFLGTQYSIWGVLRLLENTCILFNPRGRGTIICPRITSQHNLFNYSIFISTSRVQWCSPRSLNNFQYFSFETPSLHVADTVENKKSTGISHCKRH